jgi:hypothetical protein
VSYAVSVKAGAPLKVLGRVGLRAKGAINGDLSGEAASVRQPHGVDEQISTLLQGLEGELRQESLPRHGGRAPKPDRRPRPRARPRRRAAAKGRGLDRPRAPRRLRRRPFVVDPAAWEDVLLIIIYVMIGIGVGLAIALWIR